MKPFAIFWDQSFLWGLFLYDTLVKLQLPFDILNAEDIRRGALQNYDVLIVPGGWAIHKKASLGERGEKAIKNFVYSGGGYLGFCGGAGFALSGENALGMVPVKRLPLRKRLPSASGTVYIAFYNDHPICADLPPTIKTTVWWPSQFDIETQQQIVPIAFYKSIGKDFWVSDIPADGLEFTELQKLELIYGINLDPTRYFLGNVAILEGFYGSGRLILSYPHLETPDDEEGNELFRKLLIYLESQSNRVHSSWDKIDRSIPAIPSFTSYKTIKRMLYKMKDFIHLGETYFLWFWRKPWLLGWKRGVRGLEYSMMVTCLAFLETALRNIHNPGEANDDSWKNRVEYLDSLFDEFLPLAKKLILKERLAYISNPVSKIDHVDNGEIDDLRSYLFGLQMNHGGLCRKIFDVIDSLLFDTLLLIKSCGSFVRIGGSTVTELPSFST